MLRLAIVLMTMALAGCARPQPDVAGKAILIVQAHPGDERNLAPMLADACLFQGARCHFLIVADANSHDCAAVTMARGVGPMLAPAPCSNRRRKEMLKSAALLGGTAEFLGWDDLFYAYDRAGMIRTIDRWSGDGGRDRLVARLMGIIGRRKPDMILASDPRHGSSCHPGRRAAATLLAEAISLMPTADRPETWLEETRDITKTGMGQRDNGALFVWPDNVAPVTWYDGAKTLPNGWQAHRFSDMVHRLHETQDLSPGGQPFAPALARMRIPLVRLSDIDWRVDMCDRLHMRLPTFDAAGNEARFVARMHAYGRGGTVRRE